MSWRGKYRGKGKGTVVYSNSRSKAENASAIQPLPLYPPLTINPLPLQDDPEMDYLLKLKRDYRKVLQESEYYFKNYEVKRDIERYSDKYNAANVYDWCPDFTELPNELKLGNGKKSKSKLKKPKTEGSYLIKNVLAKLEANEDKEIDPEEELEEKKVKADGNEDDEEEEDEEDDDQNNEDFDAENDYVNNYFDNGEGYEDASDTNDNALY